MVDTLAYIAEKYGVDPKSQVKKLPNIGREHLAELFCELGYKVGAEIGVYRGEYSEQLCRKNPGLKLYCIDPWSAREDYRDTLDEQDAHNENEESTRRRIAGFDCEILKTTSLDAVENFEPESLDFVYIDGQHDFINVARDIEAWSKRVRAGGIVAGHDYVRFTERHDRYSGHHVLEVVDAWTKAYYIAPLFLTGSKGRGGKLPDVWRSFFWVKEPFKP